FRRVLFRSNASQGGAPASAGAGRQRDYPAHSAKRGGRAQRGGGGALELAALGRAAHGTGGGRGTPLAGVAARARPDRAARGLGGRVGGARGRATPTPARDGRGVGVPRARDAPPRRLLLRPDPPRGLRVGAPLEPGRARAAV